TGLLASHHWVQVRPVYFPPPDRADVGHSAPLGVLRQAISGGAVERLLDLSHVCQELRVLGSRGVRVSDARCALGRTLRPGAREGEELEDSPTEGPHVLEDCHGDLPFEEGIVTTRFVTDKNEEGFPTLVDVDTPGYRILPTDLIERKSMTRHRLEGVTGAIGVIYARP
ncbi:MAG TPA: hypothetical protein VNP72_07790, partial [Longimicrobium sp.]|nr:hypothetical protein [Longimicrobium sp.]